MKKLLLLGVVFSACCLTQNQLNAAAEREVRSLGCIHTSDPATKNGFIDEYRARGKNVECRETVIPFGSATACGANPNSDSDRKGHFLDRFMIVDETFKKYKIFSEEHKISFDTASMQGGSEEDIEMINFHAFLSMRPHMSTLSKPVQSLFSTFPISFLEVYEIESNK